VADHDARLAEEPRPAGDLRRPVPGAADLDGTMTVREGRTVPASLTPHCDKVVLILPEPGGTTRGPARRRATVVNHPDGRFAIRHNGPGPSFRVFDELAEVDHAAIAESKRLGAVLVAHPRERRDAYGPAWNRDRRPAPPRATISGRRLQGSD
jgi:hypothetical protein